MSSPFIFFHSLHLSCRIPLIPLLFTMLNNINEHGNANVHANLCVYECMSMSVQCTPFYTHTSLSFVHTSITIVPLVVYLILCHFMMASRSVQLCTMDTSFFLNLLLLALCDSLVFLFSCSHSYTHILFFDSGSAENVRKKTKTTIRYQKMCV